MRKKNSSYLCWNLWEAAWFWIKFPLASVTINSHWPLSKDPAPRQGHNLYWPWTTHGYRKCDNLVTTVTGTIKSISVKLHTAVMQEVEGSQGLRCTQEGHSDQVGIMWSSQKPVRSWHGSLFIFWLSVLMYKLRCFIKIYTISLDGWHELTDQVRN